jgi:RNA polymerase sigma factor (sigma-70 family)
MKATLARLSRLTTDPLSADDGSLLAAFLGGDQSAFAVLVRRHAALVFATCRRILRHQQDAEDAFQATFLVLARRAADVWPREAVGPWLFGVAHRVALKARAGRSRQVVREQPLVEVAADTPAAPDCDLAEVVHRVVCKLPEVYRAAVVACDLEGLSRKEAAERLGWSEGTLSGRLARARELLARRFHRLGLTLPVSGLAAVFGPIGSVSAAVIQTTIELAAGTAAVGVSAPVAALTEGVVRSMTFFKFKAMVAVVFTACVLGLGAFAASGAGAGDEPGTRPGESNQLVPVAAKPAVAPPRPKPAAKPTSDLDRLKGTWRVVGMSESGKAIPLHRLLGPVEFGVLPLLPPQGGKTTLVNLTEPVTFKFGAGTLQMPFLEEGKVWKHRAFNFGIDEKKTPREITLFAANRPVGRGIYEFTIPAAQCASCHKNPFAGDGVKLPELLAVCPPVLKDPHKTDHIGVRLALSIDGKRPTKFGGNGVIVFELKRPDPQDGERARLTAEVKKITEALRRTVDAKAKQRLQAEMELLREQLAELTLREEQQTAAAKLRLAEIDLEQAKIQAQIAQAHVENAVVALQLAKQRVAAAEKAVADVKKPKPRPEDAVFTVHVRTLTAAEKVIRVKVTGKETVLGGLVYAADDIAIMTGSVNVWLVRGKKVLPVDLPAITQKGDARTNYTLQIGDQLFVQAKPAK